MATLPPVTLGAIIFGAFLLGYVMRGPLERRWVSSADLSKRPNRQFIVEMTCVLTAGILAVAFNTTVYQFPLGSGISLLFGCLVSGFFIGLDLSLARERKMIVEAIKNLHDLPPESPVFPRNPQICHGRRGGCVVRHPDHRHGNRP